MIDIVFLLGLYRSLARGVVEHFTNHQHKITQYIKCNTIDKAMQYQCSAIPDTMQYLMQLNSQFNAIPNAM